MDDRDRMFRTTAKQLKASEDDRPQSSIVIGCKIKFHN
jgi:hypothetical protein